MDKENAENTENTASRAYALWEQAGRPEGEADRFWHEAEQELNGGAQGAAPDAARTAMPGETAKRKPKQGG